jgi:hypothetical protein
MDAVELIPHLADQGGVFASESDLPPGLTSGWTDLFASFPLLQADTQLACFEKPSDIRRFREIRDEVAGLEFLFDGFVIGSVDDGDLVVVQDQLWMVDFLDGRPFAELMAHTPDQFIQLHKSWLEHYFNRRYSVDFQSILPPELHQGWGYWESFLDCHANGVY